MKKNKTFVSFIYYPVIHFILNLCPYLIMLPCLDVGFSLPFVILPSIATFAFFMCDWHRGFRMIFVRNGYISPSRELSPFFRLQHYFKIPINSIVEIKCNGLLVLERAGKFNKKIKYQYYLDLIMNDNTFERLFMSTFTHKQYLKLKAILLENNPRIVFGDEPEKFLDYFTSCV